MSRCIVGKLKNSIYSNRKMLWYMFCFALLGLIDQRKQSAPGEIQMLFGNCTPLVIAALLLPSMELHKFRQKLYAIWTPICAVLAVLACIWGKTHMPYMQAWIPVVLSMAVWSYLLIYLVREWKNTEGPRRVRQPFFWGILLLLFCMILSVNRDNASGWYLVMYGGFYLIGVRGDDRRDFFHGLLNAIVLWFFAQQILAFGFRPYDYLRYKGMYVWETFNGLFYLIVYCAFMLKWFLAKERKAHWCIRLIWFFLSAGSVSFTLLTGGRAAVVGIVFTTIILYGWYDLKKSTSFYQLLLHAATWVLCVVISFPLVYGCVRYLPTILHHPIWFVGEYEEGHSVCSFDPWDSEKYISFEEALDMSVGRVLDLIGIDLNEVKILGMDEPLIIRAYAADERMNVEVGDKILNSMGTVDYNSSISVRKMLYLSVLAQLNWQGHVSGEIYAADGILYSHAHNMYLDMAYRHGIVAGVLYLGICGYAVLQVLWRHKRENIFLIVFMVALISFGMFEQLVLMGQFGLALVWIFFYFAGENSKVLQIRKQAEGNPE